jgi:uracil-DNA glycosylase
MKHDVSRSSTRKRPGPRPRSNHRADGLRLADLHARIRACTKCVEAGFLERARPIVAGSIRDRIAIVGQAPGAVELTTGQPFSGRSGAELKRWLAEAGIDEGHLPYRTAITKCFPGKSPMGSGDRRPSPAEIAFCAPWLDEELALLRPRVILLLGGLAIDRFWGKVPLEDAVGRTRLKDGVTFIPLPHPSGASRWLNDPAHRDLLRNGLAHVRRAARTLDSQGTGPTMRVPRRKSAALPFTVALPQDRGWEEVIIDMPKKKKAAKKKH